MIEKETGADMLEINTAKPYTGSYNEIVDQGHREINSNFLPELKPFEANFDKYDTIIIGSPVWWYTYAPAMRSFLNKVKLSGKTVYPFATNGGWIGHTFEDFAAALPDCTVEKGLMFTSTNQPCAHRKPQSPHGQSKSANKSSN